MNTETIIAIVAAIMAGGFGLFNNLARRKVEKKLTAERRRQRDKLQSKVDGANERAETALEKYERMRDARNNINNND